MALASPLDALLLLLSFPSNPWFLVIASLVLVTGWAIPFQLDELEVSPQLKVLPSPLVLVSLKDWVTVIVPMGGMGLPHQWIKLIRAWFRVD